LWIGLFTSLLIFVEAVTGLLMLEPWLMGAGRPPAEQRVMLERSAAGEVQGRPGAGAQGGEAGRNYRNAGQGSGIMVFVKNLHAGRVGGTDVSFLLDVAAVGMIVMTVTGMILTVKALRRNRTGRVR